MNEVDRLVQIPRAHDPEHRSKKFGFVRKARIGETSPDLGSRLDNSPLCQAGERGDQAHLGQECVAFLPVPSVTRKCPKPGPFPDGPKTLGEHLKAKRLVDRLTQKELAKRLGVAQHTVIHWEVEDAIPRPEFMGRVIGYLGFDPQGDGQSLQERMVAFRRRNGLTQKKASLRMGVDPASWSGWESGRRVPCAVYAMKIREFVGMKSEAPPADETFGGFVLRRRLAAGLTQKELGTLLGVQKGTVQTWERGRVLLSLERRAEVRAILSNRASSGDSSLTAEVWDAVPGTSDPMG